MQQMLSEWLAREAWDSGQLMEWLQGYGLPPVGHDEEPYVWLLRGLPLADERHRAETTLATRIARVLEDRPDVKRPGRRPDQLLYNLLMLCAGLSCPDQLAEPLEGVLKRSVIKDGLKGEWLGVSLRYALQRALILNQVDGRLLPDWEVLMSGRRHNVLPGGVAEGFEGVRLMPPSASERGSPALNAIGKGLGAMAALLGHDKDRREMFGAVVNRLTETYPGRPTWFFDLLHQAIEHQWGDWAMQVVLGMQHIPDKYAMPIRDELRRNPYRSVRALGGVLAHQLAVIEARLDGGDPEKGGLERAHENSLRSLAVGA